MTRAALACVVLAVALAPSARGNGPFETFGVDPRSKAMGQANTALPSGPAASHYNPAALSLLEEPELSLSFSLSLPSVRAETQKEPVDPAHAPRLPPTVAGTAIGLGLPLSGALEGRLYLGVSAYLPSFTLTHAAAPDPITPFLYLYDSYTDHYEIEPALSLKWFDWLSTGIGLRIGAGQRGLIDLALDPLRRRVTRQAIQAEQYPIHAPTAGVLFGPIGFPFFKAAVGLSYRERLTTPLAIVSQVRLDGLDVDVFLPVAMQANFSPRTFGGGLTFVYGLTELLPLLGDGEVAVDLGYAVWSEAPTPFLAVRGDFSGEGLEDLGFDGALDAPGPGESRIRPAGFRDTLSVRVGAEHRLFEGRLSLRAGYAYRPTPVPDQTSGTNIVDSDAHVVSLGVGGWVDVPFGVIERPLAVDLGLQSQLLSPRIARKVRADDPVGDWRVSGRVDELSVGIGYRF